MHCMGDLKAMGARLARARKAAGYSTARQATNARGWVYSTYKNHENGDRDFSSEASRYAASFGVNVEWLLTGRGTMTRHGTHPVLDLFESLPPEKQAQFIDYGAYLRDRKE